MLVLVLLVSACEVQKVVKVECNKPYIKVGTSCCLDKDDNAICDKDEVKEEPKVEVKEEPVEEDSCGNDICDSKESCKSCQEDCGKCFSLYGVQSSIKDSTTYDVVLSETNEDSKSQIYTYSELKTKLLGKYPVSGEGSNPQEPYYKVLSKTKVLVAKIKDKSNFIKDKTELLSYLESIKGDILISVGEAGSMFQEDLKRDLPDLMYKVEKSANTVIQSERYDLVDFEITDEKEFFDTISMSEAGDKIAEILFITADTYDVTYKMTETNHDEPRELSALNYIYAMAIHCSPSFVVVLYAKEEHSKTNYDKYGIEQSYFMDDIRADRKKLLEDSTSMAKTCEELYDFNY